MSFAKRESFAGQGFTSSGSNVTLPAGIVAGNLLVMVVGVRQETVNAVAGWTTFHTSNGNATQHRLFWRKADGKEGANVNVTVSSSANWSAIIYRYSGAADPEVRPPEADSAFLDSDDANPDSPNLLPTGGEKDYVWVSAYFMRADYAVSVFPANYVNTGSVGGGGGDANRMGYCDRELNASSENPGAFTAANTADWTASTIVIHPAAEVDKPLGPAVIRQPWTKQPPTRRGFDKNNILGKHCLWAVIPAWDSFDGNGVGVTVGGVTSVGQRMFMATTESGTSNPTVRKVSRSFANGIGPVGTALFEDAGATEYYIFERTDNDIGIRFPDPKNLTIVSIVRPTGDGTGGGLQDPRIFSQDLNSDEQDHDLMIGFVSGDNYARTRIRLNTTTYTVLTGDIQADALNLVAGHVFLNTPTDIRVACSHIREDGVRDRTIYGSGQPTVGYNPRTTTDMAIGGNTNAANDNPFNGEIIGLWAFDRDMNLDELQMLFDAPWQIFKSETIFIPEADVVKFVSTDVPWTKQPPPGTEIDWSNPITNGMRFCGTVNRGQPWDEVLNEVGVGSGGSESIELTDLGPSAAITLDTTGRYEFAKHDEIHGGLSALSIMTLAKNRKQIISGTGSEIPFGHLGSSDDPWFCDWHQGEIWEMNIVTDNAGGTAYQDELSPGMDASTPEQAQDWNVLGGTWDGATLIARAGRRKGPGVATLGVSQVGGSSDNVPCLSNGTVASSASWDGWVALGVMWDRGLSDTEWDSLVDNPWQIFKPAKLHAPIGELKHEFMQVQVPWTEKPPVGTPLRTDGLAAKLSSFIVTDAANEGVIDVVTGTRAALGSGHSIRFDPKYGAYVHKDAATVNAVSLDYTTLKNDWTNVVHIAYIGRRESDPSTTEYECFARTSGFEAFRLGSLSATTAIHRIGDTDQTNVLVDNWQDWYVLGGNRVSGIGSTAMTNTEEVFDAGSTAAPDIMGSDLLLCRDTGPALDFAVMAIWTRALAYDEHLSFYDNPWQVFEPKTILVPRDTKLPDIAVVEDEW